VVSFQRGFNFCIFKQPHQNGALSSKLSEVHFKRRLDVMTLAKGVYTILIRQKTPFVKPAHFDALFEF
jgi:hypothetical protein